MADPGFPVEGAWTPNAGTFRRKCMQRRKNWVPWGGGGHVPGTLPLDPPMIKFVLAILQPLRHGPVSFIILQNHYGIPTTDFKFQISTHNRHRCPSIPTVYAEPFYFAVEVLWVVLVLFITRAKHYGNVKQKQICKQTRSLRRSFSTVHVASFI